jgi:hypothetical protein
MEVCVLCDRTVRPKGSGTAQETGHDSRMTGQSECSKWCCSGGRCKFESPKTNNHDLGGTRQGEKRGEDGAGVGGEWYKLIPKGSKENHRCENRLKVVERNCIPHVRAPKHQPPMMDPSGGLKQTDSLQSGYRRCHALPPHQFHRYAAIHRRYHAENVTPPPHPPRKSIQKKSSKKLEEVSRDGGYIRQKPNSRPQPIAAGHLCAALKKKHIGNLDPSGRMAEWEKGRGEETSNRPYM